MRLFPVVAPFGPFGGHWGLFCESKVLQPYGSSLGSLEQPYKGGMQRIMMLRGN
jgi:hypothetical protein